MGLPDGSKESKFIAYLVRLETELIMEEDGDPNFIGHGYASDLPGPSTPPPPP